MDRHDVGHGKTLRVRGVGHGELHRVDVVEELERRGARDDAGFCLRFRARHGAHADLHSLDFRGGDGFRPQEQAGEWCQRECPWFIQATDRELCVGDVASEGGRQVHREALERIGNERLVPTRAPVPRRRIECGIEPPRLLDPCARHGVPILDWE